MECKVGRIQAIREESVDVLVERHSACSGCHAKSMCSSSDRKDELFTITEFPAGIQIGDRVRVVPSGSGKPIMAVLYAFVIPLIILLTEAVIFSIKSISESLLLMIMTGSLVLYAVILWFMRGFFESRFRLRVELLP